MPNPTKPVILFIEDEANHFSAIAEHLPRYRCIRAGATDLGNVVPLARQIQPVAAVVDLMLFTDSIVQARQELEDYVQWLEDLVYRRIRRARPQPHYKGEIKSGASCVTALKQACPGIRIIICSQLLAGVDLVSGIAKRLDLANNLLNGKQIADTIRTQIEG